MARAELGPHGGLQKANRFLVAGLAWSPIAVVTEYKAGRRKIAEAVGGDATALWRAKAQTKAQVGVARTAAGAPAGSYALAATLAANLGDDWIALLHLDGGSYAVVAVPKGGAIAKDLVGTAETMLAAWHSEIAEAEAFKAPYKHTYIDSPIDGAEGQALPAAAFNAVDAKNGRLELLGRAGKSPNSKEKAIGLPFILAGAIGLAVIGLMVYQHKQAQDLAERRRIHKANNPAQVTAAPSKVAQILPPEWEGRPSATDVLVACAAIEKKIPLVIAGWKISRAVCSVDGSAVIEYRRYGVATNVGFIRGVIDQFGAPPQVGKEHDVGTVTMPVPMPAARKEKLLGADQAQAMLQSRLQAAGVQFQLPEKPLPTAKGDHPADIRPWKQWSLTIQGTDVTPVATTELPSLLFGTFDMPGFRLTRITARREEGKAALVWDIEGDLYAL